ncbi:hypothetical protein TPAU25S_00932 [Tsukamurella paurometabola]
MSGDQGEGATVGSDVGGGVPDTPSGLAGKLQELAVDGAGGRLDHHGGRGALAAVVEAGEVGAAVRDLGLHRDAGGAAVDVPVDHAAELLQLGHGGCGPVLALGGEPELEAGAAVTRSPGATMRGVGCLPCRRPVPPVAGRSSPAGAAARSCAACAVAAVSCGASAGAAYDIVAIPATAAGDGRAGQVLQRPLHERQLLAQHGPSGGPRGLVVDEGASPPVPTPSGAAADDTCGVVSGARPRRRFTPTGRR